MVAVRREMTKAEFAAIDKPGHYDLVDGELWSVTPTKIPHGHYAAELTTDLNIYLRANGGGRVYSNDPGFVIDETGRTILCPDVAFVRTERIPPGLDDFFPGAPDLAVEVISRSERPKQVRIKVARYLAGGTRLVWCVYPERKQVVVHSDQQPPLTLGANDVLDGGELLPGFRLALSALFTE